MIGRRFVRIFKSLYKKVKIERQGCLLMMKNEYIRKDSMFNF